MTGAKWQVRPKTGGAGYDRRPRRIRAAVEQRFAQVARSPGQETKFPVGPASAKKLGYGPQEIDSLPISATESFCGVGNPLGLGEIRPARPCWTWAAGWA